MNVSTTPRQPESPRAPAPASNEIHELSGLLRAVESSDADRALTAAKTLVRRDARVTIPRLVTHLEERFSVLLETGPTILTDEGNTACIALAIELEPLLWRIRDTSWQERISDLSHRGMFNPINL